MTSRPPWYPVATVEEAVAVLLDILGEDRDLTIDRSVDADSLEALHAALGGFVSNSFGLKGGNPDLLEDCGTADAEEASSIILRNVWQRLTEGNRP